MKVLVIERNQDKELPLKAETGETDDWLCMTGYCRQDNLEPLGLGLFQILLD